MVIILLMSLLTNSNICVNSGSVLIAYSSIMGHNFLLCRPDNFDWLLDFMNFTLMDAGYFCVTVNILTLLYVTQLNSLGTV